MILASFAIKRSCVSSSVPPVRCNIVDAFCLKTTRLDSPGEERTAMSSKKWCWFFTRRDLFRSTFLPNNWYWWYSSTEFHKRELSFNFSPMTSSNAGSVFLSSFESFLAAEIDLGDTKLAMQLTWYRTSPVWNSLEAPSTRTLTWLAISSLRYVQASNIDSLNPFLPGPAYAVR